MDLNLKTAYFRYVTHQSENEDTALRLERLPSVDDGGCGLVLGLGPTPTLLSKPTQINRVSSSNPDSILQLGLGGSFNADQLPTHHNYSSSSSYPAVDEHSTFAKNSGGYTPSLLLPPQFDTNETLLPASDQRPHSTKRCRFTGCTKGARGATALCIGHGGGQRCQKPGCNKGSETRTVFCKAHGGGRRCQHLGCTKSAEGKTEFCIAHGGGRRCAHQGGCNKAARGKSGLCIRHGGGKRCRFENCTRSAEGKAGLCISHGGGRRCQVAECTKGAQGSTRFCKAHGGGRRCVFVGCSKGAEGSTPLCKGHGGGKRCMFDGGGICPKSVHGGTSFCVAHGGGKRCVVAGCSKSARGRTDRCVRHGGGKRCRVEWCGKSAQGSMDLCKAHGGGKRCQWGGGEAKCQKFARGKSGLCAAHTSLVHGKNKKGIGPGLFHGLVASAASSAATSVVSYELEERPAKRQQLIPPQVLVLLSMKSVSSMYSESEMTAQGSGGGAGFDGCGVPEGRVHGGGLMSLLGAALDHLI